MEPELNRFGGGVTSTVMHPLIAVAMLITGLLIFFLPRKYVIVALLPAAFFIPIGQVVVVGGLHFLVLRILILAGCARLLWSKLRPQTHILAGGFNRIDWAFTLWALFWALSFILTWMQTQALINRLGFLLDALGGYFLLRFLIQDREDVRRAIKIFALIAVIMAIGMINEQLTRQNIFWSVGGGFRLDGTSMSVSDVREGRIRSQGPFEVYILAGVFGAALLPFFVSLWTDGKSRIAAITGVISSTIMVFTSASSTPIFAYAAGIIGLCFWPLRQRMRTIRWGIVMALVALYLVLKTPVWALILRMDLTGASSAFHRYMLVDNFIRHFADWWLLGVKDYNNWGLEMWDLSNQYVACGLTGGLVTLVCFIALITQAFGKLGTARKSANGEWFLWSLGVALLAHVVAYFGVSYDTQMQFAWFALLAIICAASSEALPRPILPPERVEVLWGESQDLFPEPLLLQAAVKPRATIVGDSRTECTEMQQLQQLDESEGRAQPDRSSHPERGARDSGIWISFLSRK